MHNAFTNTSKSAAKVFLYTESDFSSLLEDPFPAARAMADAQGFRAKAGQKLIAWDSDGKLAHILYGLGNGRDALVVAGLSSSLPEGTYTIANNGGYPMAHIAAGWADGAYKFDRYLGADHTPPRLHIKDKSICGPACIEADAVALLRDLVNTPAGDMGPDKIHEAVSDMAQRYDAKLSAIIGDNLLDENYPLVHAVGRAADNPPRFLELEWGKTSNPQLALVGKGVAFDSGGLNIKVGDGMRIMKKDMGGAAHAIALTQLVMANDLPVHLKLYVPTVENAISGNAFRPGDIVPSRKGLSVEIDNTDAEGRLILADALARASEGDPDLLIDFATLTGAARVALGPDLAPVYTDDETLADQITQGARVSGDPIWRMPLWDPYLAQLKSPIADLVNSGGRMGGSITAGLFLKQFVDAKTWVHLDVWAWRLAKYGRAQGAAACGLRAMWAMLDARYGAKS